MDHSAWTGGPPEAQSLPRPVGQQESLFVPVVYCMQEQKVIFTRLFGLHKIGTVIHCTAS